MAGTISKPDRCRVSTIYRTTEGRHAVRTWCEARLSEWDHPHRTRMVPSMLGPTHVVTAGNGPDLVLLPGTNFAAATWLDLIASLATRYTVHSIDLPGQPGLSAADRRTRSGAHQGAWLTEVLSTVGTGRPVLVAHSLGAVAALRATAAGLVPERLVLVDPAGVMRLKVSMDVMRATMPWLVRPNAATSDALLTMMMSEGHRPGPELVTWMSLVGQHVKTSLAPAPLPDRVLRGLQGTPIDVIAGEDDCFLPPTRLRRAVQRRLPDANLEIITGAGHLVPHERPDALHDLLDNVEATDQRPHTDRL